ncbi:5-formyltetrahydrofolate cyclo-ligase [Picosynechococcus sp. PCC 7003]|uniref:5-formyltetrahydrofolate cyclo-ligase n=1 Tax=Picosynechococcus sp. PCC 7003 TaxID=374981 RepID=UPI00081078E4|nr:5-formyltetrahydrofolate cyclo-ligase [Picosynechococcus sp. PCC 7003]ANV85101.1 5-formyltetrahydrofolate cyclo-ligase [Picosynechococcus sp. PCC 7003]
MTHSPWQHYNPAKATLRQTIWDRLGIAGATVTPPHGHIPNFVGAIAAAEQLSTLDIWRQATVIKCNPDKAQAPVRYQALAAGKTLYMAVPQLVDESCFVAITREQVPQGLDLAIAAEKNNILKYGRPVSFVEMEKIDLAVVGCVAVSLAGGRTGKGAGFADLELALLQRFGLVNAKTTIVTTVHNLQVVPPEALPLEAHDWPMDWLCTPTNIYQTHHNHPQPQGLDWQQIRPQQWETIPILNKLYRESSP